LDTTSIKQQGEFAMYRKHMNNEQDQNKNIPIIDGDFDSFELNHDLECTLREADAATFYHDAPDLEE